MRCSGCGKDIPFGGVVCPHCQRPKAGDQRLHIIAVAVALLAGAIGAAVNGLAGGIVGLLLGALAGGLLAGLLGPGKSKPPQVRIADAKSDNPDLKQVKLAEKLRELEALKKDGLISDSEYVTKRQQLLASL